MLPILQRRAGVIVLTFSAGAKVFAFTRPR
jgi:hypothetical protein